MEMIISGPVFCSLAFQRTIIAQLSFSKYVVSKAMVSLLCLTVWKFCKTIIYLYVVVISSNNLDVKRLIGVAGL